MNDRPRRTFTGSGPRTAPTPATAPGGRAGPAPRPGGAPVRLGLLAATFVAMLALTMLGPMMTITGADLTGAGNWQRQAGYVAITVLTMVALRPLHDWRRLLTVPLPIALALAWCLLSIAWSIAPGVGFRRLLLTAMVIWSVFAAVRWLGYERTVNLTRWVLLVSLVLSYIVVFAYPELGIHQADEVYDKKLIGDWRGIFMHKNTAGAICAFAVLMFAFDRGRMPRWLQIGAVALAVGFLVMTTSRTSLGVCAGAAVLGALFTFYHARYRLFLIGAIIVALLVGSIYINIYNAPFSSVLDDRTAFTGRTLIWDALIRYTIDNPLGSGFGSFWNIGSASPIFQYARGWVITVTEGHNGFLDLAATIGIPGLILVVALVVVWPLVRLLGSEAASGQRGAMLLAVMVFCIAHNGTESSLMDRDTILQVMLMLTIALIWSVTRAPLRRTPARPAFAADAPRKPRTFGVEQA